MPDKANNAIIISARMGSKRLPGKSMMKINNKFIIEHVASQLEGVNWPFYFAIPDAEIDNSLNSFLSEKYGSEKVFRGNPVNVANRIWTVKNCLKLDNIMRITGDDPCHSSNLVNASISEFHTTFKNAQYMSVIFNTLPDGLYHEIISSKKIDEINEWAKEDKLSAEHVTYRLKKTRKKDFSYDYNQILEKYEVSNLKLSLDTSEDFQFLKKLSRFTHDNKFDTEGIIDAFRKNQSFQ